MRQPRVDVDLHSRSNHDDELSHKKALILRAFLMFKIDIRLQILALLTDLKSLWSRLESIDNY